MGSDDPHDPFKMIAFAAGWLHLSGLDPSTSGNISILQRKVTMSNQPLGNFNLPCPYPALIDLVLFITRAGSTMKEVIDRPLENIGAYRVEQGTSMSLIDGAGPPSSEIAAHLEIYKALLMDDMSILHFHDDPLLERISSFSNTPDWIRMIPELMPGSIELAKASAEAAASSCLLVWRGHGLTVISETVEDAIVMVERAMAL